MTPPEVDINRKINELSLLFEISRILDTSPDIRDVINTVLKSLADYMGMERGTVSLLNRQTGKITIEAAYKLTPAQIARGVYSPGEGITGKVVQSGKPMIIPDILKEPTFINKTGARRSLKDHPLSFICVPVRLGNETMGALSVDKRPSGGSPLEDDLRLLTITSSMIAQAVKLRRNFQEDRLTLLEENRRLQKELKDRYKPANIIGNSSVMEEVFELIAQVSRSDASVLILGESGTGKELVAREIHYNSLRADNPLIKVNCAALPESVIESELFGHE
ncbi:MAG: sigma 54-interacting transcriptional regulator, partial [Spirochaetales bacterium]|nr:sigma 54-interacting transcriptional regulator [Spirochaetales bacterium]